MDINAARAAEATEGGLDKLGELLSWRDSKLFSEAERLRSEFVIQVKGKIRARPPGTVNANLHHYAMAAEALAQADPKWLARLITRRDH